ncbi:hypothetical protein DF160_33295 [Burkholderia anthina]|nr:hypothetical protein DF160_33295 [Burkholderia anthina]
MRVCLLHRNAAYIATQMAFAVLARPGRQAHAGAAAAPSPDARQPRHCARCPRSTTPAVVPEARLPRTAGCVHAGRPQTIRNPDIEAMEPRIGYVPRLHHAVARARLPDDER